MQWVVQDISVVLNSRNPPLHHVLSRACYVFVVILVPLGILCGTTRHGFWGDEECGRAGGTVYESARNDRDCSLMVTKGMGDDHEQGVNYCFQEITIVVSYN
jgi:hypothetical protein